MLGEFERGLLEARVTLLGREPGREVGEQRAPLIPFADVAETDREQETELEVLGQDGPRAAQRLDPIRLLAEALVRLDQQAGGRSGLLERQCALGHRHARSRR